ncbi:MAG: T9SS type A sorting domain-containing protein [Bacteroidetes bacterium]|nr:T9SS type A sorting domain-containing protein [Bacteroidota bacterium]
MNVSSTQKLLVLLFFLAINKLCATTIIPFHDLGEMTAASTLVVQATVGETHEVGTSSLTFWHTDLQIEFVVKGDVALGSTIELEHLTTKGNGWIKAIPDDVNLKPGKSYLLFLIQTNTGFWRPILMSYGIFEQFQPNNDESYLVPLPEWADLNLINPNDGKAVEPLAVYRKNDLLFQLQQIAASGIHWDKHIALVTTDVQAFYPSIGERTAPAHCTFLNSGGTGFRWLDFPGTAVSAWYELEGDTDCPIPTSANDYVVAAVGAISSYMGTNLVNGGTYSGFMPDCMDDGAIGNDFINWVDNNLGGQRNIVVQYNDPCDEITDLSSCAGILAFGGLNGFTPINTFDGNPYYEGGFGFVVVNNGVCGCLNASQYAIMLTHEMTHSLGLDHIAGNGTANMNPNCCTNITNLDRQCVDYLYPVSLPVELTDFYGTAISTSIELNWTTASEQNSQSFEVERSRDGEIFDAIGNTAGAGNSKEIQHYQFVDHAPFSGLNYYRLRQTDFDGQYTYGKVIAVLSSNIAVRFKVMSNPVVTDQLHLILENSVETTGEIQLFNQQGELLKSEPVQLTSGINYLEIPFPNHPPGSYFARLIMKKEVRVARFIKT